MYYVSKCIMYHDQSYRLDIENLKVCLKINLKYKSLLSFMFLCENVSIQMVIIM